ncbi:hypothetical protein K435DRAFT_656042, partial [Dendrothele bispora CBS 962.96]
ACDYRVRTDGSRRKAWLSANEMSYSLLLRSTLVLDGQHHLEVYTTKFGNGQLQRKTALEGHRFTPKEALDAGIMDYLAQRDTKVVLAKAEEAAGQRAGNAKGGVLGIIKTEIYRNVLDTNRKGVRVTDVHIEDAATKARLSFRFHFSAHLHHLPSKSKKMKLQRYCIPKRRAKDKVQSLYRLALCTFKAVSALVCWL